MTEIATKRPCRDLELTLDFWRIGVDIPGRDGGTGVHLELGGQDADGNRYGNLCLCAEGDESVHAPGTRISFGIGIIPALLNDGYVFATPEQIHVCTLVMMTGTKTYLRLGIEELGDGRLAITDFSLLSHSSN